MNRFCDFHIWTLSTKRVVSSDSVNLGSCLRHCSSNILLINVKKSAPLLYILDNSNRNIKRHVTLVPIINIRKQPKFLTTQYRKVI